MIHESKQRASESQRRALPPSIVARKFSGPERSGADTLRQRLGNQGVQRLMSEIVGHSKGSAATRFPAIQTKLTISQPGDAHEREADRVADAVMRVPENKVVDTSAVPSTASPAKLQRLCTECEEENHKALPQVQKKEQAVNTPPLTSPVAANIQNLRGGGSALPAATRAFFEPRFGADFSSVRVHTGKEAQESAELVSARAFTLGTDIGFASGQYSPDSRDGRHLLAHELTHVVQQTEAHAAQDGVVQRDLAIEPPSFAAKPNVLTAAQITGAITFNNNVLASVPNKNDVIELIRDIVGAEPLPAVIDKEFVRGVVWWQAKYSLPQDGKLTPATARPLFREIGAERVGHGEVKGGPSYSPAGPINVPRATPRKAHFKMSAEFKNDPAKGILPACCEVRQDIQWDNAFVAAAVAAKDPPVPNTDFPITHPANTWIEDRDSNSRYGHRAGPLSRPTGSDQYLDNTARNQALGHLYEGKDAPQVTAHDRGNYRFRLRVIDVCNGNKQLAVSPTLRVHWL